MRTVEIDGEPWFVGKDVAAALGYKDTVNALKAHVDDEDKAGWQIATQFGEKETTIINESGVYSLIFSSRLEKAKAFKRWVTSEVLPAIRKKGGYLTPAADQLAALVQAQTDMALSVQSLIQRVDTIEQRGRRTPLQALSSGNNPFEDCVPPIKPPSNKIRRQWMRVASEKLDLLADKSTRPW